MDTTTPMGRMGLDERARIRGELMEQLVPRIKGPRAQAANAAHIALDHHYDAGLTVPEWVSAVGQALNMETDGVKFGEQEPRTQPEAEPVPQQTPEPKPPGGAPPDEDEEDDEPEDEEDDEPLPSEARSPPTNEVRGPATNRARSPAQEDAAARHAEAGHNASKPPTNEVRGPLPSEARKGKQRR